MDTVGFFPEALLGGCGGCGPHPGATLQRVTPGSGKYRYRAAPSLSSGTSSAARDVQLEWGRRE